MGGKNFILDTNVFLHDPSALKKFGDNTIIVPVMVLEELDMLKRNSDERGKNARILMRYIDSLKEIHGGDFQKGVKIPEGSTIKVHLDKPTEKVKNFPLLLDRNSNRILQLAYLLKEKGEKIVFVSKDFITRVKAEAMGIEAEDYLQLKTSYEELYKGLRTIEVEKKDVDQFYKDKKLSLKSHKFEPNEYCIMKSPERSSAICKYSGKSKKLEPLLQVEKGVWGIHPLNTEQKCVMDLLIRDDIHLVTLVGPAGTGKTLMALSCGLFQVFDEAKFSKILVSRPIIPLGKDIGYLPGTKEEKLFHWMQPIYDNLEFVCECANGEGNGRSTLEWVMESKKIEMEAVTYIRGRTLPKIYMIIDEAQNLTPHEVKTIISRAGKNTKVILTGDPTQIDNPYLDKDSNGLNYVVNTFKGQNLYGHVFLEKTERSQLAEIAAKIM
jgi:PhoH-like ATPase